MITPAFCQMMARYNAWQNNGLLGVLDVMDEDALRQDRGLFFGSILGTLNHLLWGDLLWMSRFDGGVAPTCGIPDSPALMPDYAAWRGTRQMTDLRITAWADTLSDCDGDLTWFSGAWNREVSKAKSTLYTHFFNHQTHHRGQVHAALTAAGYHPQDTDLFMLPKDA